MLYLKTISKTKYYINNIYLIFLLIILCLIYLNVDYQNLVDANYYINATVLSSSITDAFWYGEDWSRDWLFVLISYLINKITSQPNFIGSIYSIILVSLYGILLKANAKKKYFVIFSIMLIATPTFIGFTLNTWRQGMAALIFSVAVFTTGPKKLIYLIGAYFLHYNSTILLLPFYIFKLKSKILLKFIFVSIFLFVVVQHFDTEYFVGLNYAYANDKENTSLIRIIFCALWFSLTSLYVGRWDDCTSFYVKETWYLILYILVVSLIIYSLFPPAVERFIQIFFVIYPLFLINALQGISSAKSFVLASLHLLFYIPALAYGASQSSIFQMVYFS